MHVKQWHVQRLVFIYSVVARLADDTSIYFLPICLCICIYLLLKVFDVKEAASLHMLSPAVDSERL